VQVFGCRHAETIPTLGHPASEKRHKGSRSVLDRRYLAWREFSAPDIARSPFNFALERHRMITCYLRYEVNPDKLADFEAYGAMWLDLMPRFGGIHHGYFLPSEGESDVALAMFSFPSLAAYEQYRKDAGADPDVQKAVAFAKETRCFKRYERSFFRPLLPKAA
jgi:hypothetical protein